MARPQREHPGPGQESVWDYPRPPAIEPVTQPMRVVHAGRTIAAAAGGWRILETSHPPVYYLAPGDFTPGVLQPNDRTSFCEWKGRAHYWDFQVDGLRITDAAWSYPRPNARYAAIAGYLAVYASRVDECWLGDERVQAQPGDYYGGWITANVVGPFKGGAGTWGW